MDKLQRHYRTLFIHPTNHGLVQFIRYGFVGGVAAVADIGSLYILTEYAHIHYLVSAALAFILGTVVNYTLSIKWIFQSSSKKKTEFVLFTLVGIGGLGLNTLIIWLAVSQLGLHYLWSKIIAVALVMIWNFSLRRLLFATLYKRSQLTQD